MQGCDASVLLCDSFSNKRCSIEKRAIPNKTSEGFDVIALIWNELERVCPGVWFLAPTFSLSPREMASFSYV